MLKNCDWPKPWFRAPFRVLGAPQNGPKMNFFVCGFRRFKFSGPTFIRCRTSLVQKFFSFGAIMGIFRGDPKVQFMWKTSLIILAVSLLRSLINSILKQILIIFTNPGGISKHSHRWILWKRCYQVWHYAINKKESFIGQVHIMFIDDNITLWRIHVVYTVYIFSKHYNN